MATVDIRPGFILQCRGPQPDNPFAQGVEVQVGFSIPAKGGVRTITCNDLVLDDESFLPRCNLLNRLGVPVVSEENSVAEILGIVVNPTVVQHARQELFESIPDDLPRQIVPTTLDKSSLPLCRLATLASV